MSSQLTQQVCSVLLPTRRRWHEAVVELEKIKDEYITTGNDELVEKFQVAKNNVAEAQQAYKTESMKIVEYEGHEIVAIDALCVSRIERVIGRTITSGGNFETQSGRVISVEIAHIESSKAYDALRILPSSLQRLFCSRNNLQELPALPSGLKGLYCSSNNLQTLPDLPSYLQELQCSNNNLRELPALPRDLRELYCSNNKLQKLPELPKGLQFLHCNDNNLLQELPELPDSLQYIGIRNTPASKNPDVIRRLEEFKDKHPSALILL
jgi:Leucine-rich repeat (LRR) protein